MAQEKVTLSVSEVNDYLKMLIDGDRVMANIFVRGEVSNCKQYASGHIYFTLKDAEGQLKCVMFRSYASRLTFRLQDGMRVVAHGRISVYKESGQYQLYADEIMPDGVGSLAMQFEQLKRRLEEEGLFDLSRKKLLPSMPGRIGVITSPSGAAVRDIINILGRRFPAAQMILYPSLVQGSEAAQNLIAGLNFFELTKLCDVIIIGRGGGSMEDLWAFNDEHLARAIAACTIPVISAVGHETDFTICDFVADRRAPTPSAAAELAVPDMGELLQSLSGLENHMRQLAAGKVVQEKRMLESICNARVFARPETLLDSFRMKLQLREESLLRNTDAAIAKKKQALGNAAGRLEALSPLSVLSRGYAAVAKNGMTVMRAADVRTGDPLEIRFADGTVTAVAKTGKEDTHGKENDAL